ncbi:MAG: hypothetical protein GC131_06620 [Alphaproteobacteria bacterium]|nr:hypothetical protein [Alphaproteobacteria bacterium]
MLFGDKTLAWFDLWSFEHFLSGIALGHIVLYARRALGNAGDRGAAESGLEKSWPYLVGLLLAYMWEPVEFYFEAGFSGSEAITHWFQGVEFWGNRLITDPAITVLGLRAALLRPFFVWPARICSLAWLAAHIFLMPHSMYLQHEILGW